MSLISFSFSFNVSFLNFFFYSSFLDNFSDFFFKSNKTLFFFRMNSLSSYDFFVLRLFLKKYYCNLSYLKKGQCKFLFDILCLNFLSSTNLSVIQKSFFVSLFLGLKGFFLGNIFFIDFYNFGYFMKIYESIKSFFFYNKFFFYPMFLKINNQCISFSFLESKIIPYLNFDRFNFLFFFKQFLVVFIYLLTLIDFIYFGFILNVNF